MPQMGLVLGQDYFASHWKLVLAKLDIISDLLDKKPLDLHITNTPTSMN
jgi:hypothetical protein